MNGEPECAFASDDSSLILNVTVFDIATTPFNLTTAVIGVDALTTPVPGLGDGAAVELIALAKLFAPSI